MRAIVNASGATVENVQFIPDHRTPVGSEPNPASRFHLGDRLHRGYFGTYPCRCGYKIRFR